MEAAARLRASSAASGDASPSIYLLVSQEPVGGRPREGAQVAQQSLSPQVELHGLHQYQRQAEHQSQVQGPRPASLQPGGLHHSQLALVRAVGGWRIWWWWWGARSFLQPGAGVNHPAPSPVSPGVTEVGGGAAPAWEEDAGPSGFPTRANHSLVHSWIQADFLYFPRVSYFKSVSFQSQKI